MNPRDPGLSSRDAAGKPSAAAASNPSFNLLDIPAFKRLMKSRWYPGVLQWPTLIIFAFITYQLVMGPSEAHGNFGTALTWVLWWPILPIMFLFAGRIWCTLCPFGTINDLVQKFVGNNRPVPRFLRNYGIWIIDAIFLLLITFGVVVSGAFFERRTWCATSASWAGSPAITPAAA